MAAAPATAAIDSATLGTLPEAAIAIAAAAPLHPVSSSGRYSVTTSTHAPGVQCVCLHDGGARISVAVAPTRGAELASLQFRGIELLHRALQFDPAPEGGWQGRGQVLFPAVGRQAGGKYTWIDGVTRDMPLHGWAKDLSFVVESMSTHSMDGASVTMSINSAVLDEKQRATYPWPFKLLLTYTLREGQLRVQHVVAHDSHSAGCAAPALMPAALGNHITLRFPFVGQCVQRNSAPSADWGAGRLSSGATVLHEYALTPGSLLSGESRERNEFLASRGGCPLSAPGATNGVFGPAPGDTSAAAGAPLQLSLVQPGALAVTVVNEAPLRIGAPQNDRPRACVAPTSSDDSDRNAEDNGASGGAGADTVSATSAATSAATSTEGALACDWRATAGARYFVLWGEPPSGEGGDAGFICPEPWLTAPDSLNTKAGLPMLAPGEAFEWAFTVSVSEGVNVN